MAWTTPRTWVTNELVTAALMNTHVRDNLNAINADGWVTSRKWKPTYAEATITAPFTTQSGTFTDVTGVSVTIDPDIAGKGLVFFTAVVGNDTQNKGTTLQLLLDAAVIDPPGTDMYHFAVYNNHASVFSWTGIVTLSGASQTIKLQCKADAGPTTAQILSAELIVIPFAT